MKIVNVEEMRRIEQAADATGHTYAAMMDMAGRSVAEAAMDLMLTRTGMNVLVLVGPGNNGGDGLVAGRYLLEAGHHITVYIWRRDAKGDENFQRLKRRRRGVAILWADNDVDYKNLRDELARTDLILDALLGTGAARPIEGKLAEILSVVKTEVLNRRNAKAEEDGVSDLLLIPRFPLAEADTFGVKLDPGRPIHDDFDDDLDDDDFDDDDLDEDDTADDLGSYDPSVWNDDLEDYDEDYLPDSPPPWLSPALVAVDCPTGLNCDTGVLDPAALAANMTVTFAFPKWGQLEYPGAGACGLLAVAPIGIQPELARDLPIDLLGPTDIAPLLPNRPPDAHKGTFGKAMIVAGSLSYTGAAALSGSAATRAGAGLVTLAIPAPLHAILAAALPETTWAVLPAADGAHSPEGVPQLLARLAGYTALLVGPGLTTLPGAAQFVERLFSPDGLPRAAWNGRLVADADTLNTLATLPGWPTRLPDHAILTPHPGEMARLTGLSAAEVNGDRIALARRFAGEWGHVVLLKGAHTVIAEPGGRAAVLPFATAVLATAGSGDVLAGAIVAMLAQGLHPYDAALCGAYLHGQAGLLVSRATGIAGATARDFVAHLPEALNQLYAG